MKSDTFILRLLSFSQLYNAKESLEINSDPQYHEHSHQPDSDFKSVFSPKRSKWLEKKPRKYNMILELLAHAKK